MPELLDHFVPMIMNYCFYIFSFFKYLMEKRGIKRSSGMPLCHNHHTVIVLYLFDYGAVFCLVLASYSRVERILPLSIGEASLTLLATQPKI